MKISIIMPSLARKALGGHKVVYEYCNYMACSKDISINIYFFPGDSLKKFVKSANIRKYILNIYLRVGNPIKWFDIHKKIKLRVITDIHKIDNSDIVIATGIETFEPVAELANEKGKKVYFIQDFENWKYSDEEVLSTYTNKTTNIVVSKWLFNIVKQKTKVDPILISNNIDTKVFFPNGKDRIPHSVIFHYRNSTHKGGKYAIQAILKLKGIYPDLNVAVISSQSRPSDLPEWCDFYENIPARRVAELNNRYQVFMCTTIDEGFGLPGLEAMACGCAVVSTKYKGVLEYAIDGENALLSPVRDVEAMIDNVVKLFENEYLRFKISQNGIRTGKERALEKSAKKFEQVLENIIA